ncbi:hypothetical protein L1049_028529 [Liquidambar formosana]|uniref:Uncharacterized protein n=1 Tax=Liquidambar formosana TaxID=63359 RepID=A0AAP0WTJ2_LIQFO
MAMAPKRSKPLHNFSLPCLKWGSQKFLRCMKIPPNTKPPTPPLHRRSHTKPINIRPSKSTVNEDRDNGLDAVRQKLMLDLIVAANNMEVSMIQGVVTEEDDSAAAEAAAAKPWNLRARRAASKVPLPPPSEEKRNSILSPARGENGNGKRTERKEKVMKFSVSLSKEEIEADFAAMIGTRPSRRPKKRAKMVQRQLDSVFPGLWLTEITPDSYKVAEIDESGKVIICVSLSWCLSSLFVIMLNMAYKLSTLKTQSSLHQGNRYSLQQLFCTEMNVAGMRWD